MEAIKIMNFQLFKIRPAKANCTGTWGVSNTVANIFLTYTDETQRFTLKNLDSAACGQFSYAFSDCGSIRSGTDNTDSSV